MRPTAGRRRKCKSLATRAAEEAVDRLELPVLPEYLKGDDEDGPSGSEEEQDAKRIRSMSTTPRSQTQMITIRLWAVPQRNPLKWEGLVTGM